MELLGGDAEAEDWLEYTDTGGMDTGLEENSAPSGGIWTRHFDPETGLTYYMNDETGEHERDGPILASRYYDDVTASLLSKYMASIPLISSSRGYEMKSNEPNRFDMSVDSELLMTS